MAQLFTQAIAHVNGRRSALEDAKRLDDGRGHAVLGLVDAEVLEGALGLSSPVPVGRHLDLAKGIALGSGVCSHSCRAGVEASELLVMTESGGCRLLAQGGGRGVACTGFETCAAQRPGGSPRHTTAATAGGCGPGYAHRSKHADF